MENEQQRQVAVAENRWRWRADGTGTNGGGEQMALGLMAVDRGKTDAIGRRSLLL
jgi:hypothetical protein